MEQTEKNQVFIKKKKKVSIIKNKKKMELLKDKKVLIALGLLVLGGGFLYLRSKKAKEDVLSTGAVAGTPPKNNYAIKEEGKDGVWLVSDGTKYAFSSIDSYKNYGSPTVTHVTKSELDLIPTIGWVNLKGELVKN
jgi:hypothetical protein